MQVSEAILLAGGEGSRLQTAVPILPKCLAPVNGRAFIDYLVMHLQSQGIQTFIFALGVKADRVFEYLEKNWPLINKKYAVEISPLGTGGAIKNAVTAAETSNVLVVNADTFFKFDLSLAVHFHEKKNAVCTMLLKQMDKADRFGTVQLNHDSQVVSFREKLPGTGGLVNAGCYILNLAASNPGSWPLCFSFESGYLQKANADSKIFGIAQDAYFIDIGIPEDYRRAETEAGFFIV